MIIYVDADACPVIRQVEQAAQKYKIKTVLISDTNHIIKSDYSEICVVDKGPDSADFYIINKCKKNDIVVTQDYGVAAMALAKGSYPIHQSGKWFTNENIDGMLMSRHIKKKARISKNKVHFKGTTKRKESDNIKFTESLEKLIESILFV